MEHCKNISLQNISESIGGIIYTEEWKSISGFEGHYQVSSFGRIKSLKRKVAHSRCGWITMKERIMSQKLKKNGYMEVNLSLDGVHSMKFVHILVATEFIQNDSKLPEVNHRYGIKYDNRASKLEWTTRSENQQHSYDVLNRDRRIGRKAHNKGVFDIYLHQQTGVYFDSQELCDFLGIKQRSYLGELRSKKDSRLNQFIKV